MMARALKSTGAAGTIRQSFRRWSQSWMRCRRSEKIRTLINWLRSSISARGRMLSGYGSIHLQTVMAAQHACGPTGLPCAMDCLHSSAYVRNPIVDTETLVPEQCKVAGNQPRLFFTSYSMTSWTGTDCWNQIPLRSRVVYSENVVVPTTSRPRDPSLLAVFVPK
jgi:hypothetical protein